MSDANLISAREYDETDDHYRPVCRTAFVALALALLGSWLALVNSLLWFVPVLVGILGFVALRIIDADGQRMLGRSAAIVAIMLSTLFAAWAPIRDVTRNRILTAEARIHAEQWLRSIQEGEVYVAHQMTLTRANRVRPADDLSEYYTGDPQRANQLEKFVTAPVINQLTEWKTDAHVEYQKTVAVKLKRNEADIEMIYKLTPPKESKQPPMLCRIALGRHSLDAIKSASWHIILCDNQVRQ